MHFLESYNNNIVKYDLINKFRYKKLIKIPYINFIVLRFRFRQYDYKQLVTALSALELITSQKSAVLKSKVSSVTLKIRKGQPVGCKITLRNENMFEFLENLWNKISFLNKKTKLENKNKTFSFKIKNVLIFGGLELNYQFFKNLKHLDINIVTTSKNSKAFNFLLRSFKFNLSKCNSIGRV